MSGSRSLGLRLKSEGIYGTFEFNTTTDASRHVHDMPEPPIELIRGCAVFHRAVPEILTFLVELLQGRDPDSDLASHPIASILSPI